MTASVRSSPRAVDVSMYVVPSFMRLRQLASIHKELAHKPDELGRTVAGHDDAIAGLVAAIRRLMEPSVQGGARKIGFTDRPQAKNA